MISDPLRSAIRYRKLDVNSRDGLTQRSSVVSSGASVVNFEDDARLILGRMLSLGADPIALRERFIYVRPDGPVLGVALAKLLERGPFALAVLDGMTEAYTMLGLSLLDNTDAAKFMAAAVRPLVRAGAAVALIDHVVKDGEARNRFAIGAQHKLAGVTVGYGIKVLKQPSRTEAGLLKLIVTKDKPGHIRPHTEEKCAALIRVTPFDGGERCDVRVEPPDRSSNEEGDWRPTVLMERISAALESTPGLSKTRIRELIKGKVDRLDQALEFMISDGYVRVEVRGPAHLHYLVRPYPEGGRVPPAADDRDPDTGSRSETRP